MASITARRSRRGYETRHPTYNIAAPHTTIFARQASDD
uniref:Uncharacterized protein n=1 Tax=Moniliophthora roreri TaxID=221103 RepID=A0A0W0G543_MONRR